jgi:hypothetical protein
MMPKFNGQNKKAIDPRYFINETTQRPGTPWSGDSKPTDPGQDNMARARGLATTAMNNQIDPDSNQDDTLELLDMLVDRIRDGSKDLYGTRDLDVSIEELMNMTVGELRDILSDQANSPEQKMIDKEYQDKEDEEMGVDQPEDMLPKQQGFGRKS